MKVNTDKDEVKRRQDKANVYPDSLLQQFLVRLQLSEAKLDNLREVLLNAAGLSSGSGRVIREKLPPSKQKALLEAIEKRAEKLMQDFKKLNESFMAQSQFYRTLHQYNFSPVIKSGDEPSIALKSFLQHVTKQGLDGFSVNPSCIPYLCNFIANCAKETRAGLLDISAPTISDYFYSNWMTTVREFWEKEVPLNFSIGKYQSDTGTYQGGVTGILLEMIKPVAPHATESTMATYIEKTAKPL